MFHKFKKQILSMILKIDDKKTPLTKNALTVIFSLVLLMFTNLSYLKIETYSVYSQRISFNDLAQQAISSSYLLKLIINVNSFKDCIYLLDGRFANLKNLCINIENIHSNETIINNKVSEFFLMKQINQISFFFFFLGYII